MKHTFAFRQVLDGLAQGCGIYGIFANPCFGTTALLMQIADEMNNRKDGTAIVLSVEHSKEQWRRRMQIAELSEERVLISDEIFPTRESIEKLINQVQSVSVMCVDYYALLDKKTQNSLWEISKQHKIPVVVCGKLCRDSGDFDPELRPELFSVSLFRDNKVILVGAFDFLALMHRNHKCDRGIGTAYRYDVSNETELIIKRNRYGELGSVFMEWDEQKLRFNY